MAEVKWEEVKSYLDEKFEPLNERLKTVETQLKSLDDSINKTEDEGKPSLRQRVLMLAWEVSQIKSTMGKVWAVVAVPPISVVLGYIVMSALNNGGNHK